MFFGFENTRNSAGRGSVIYHEKWLFILYSQFFGNWLLILVLYVLRVRAKYSYREIEDIIVYDSSKRKAKDFDSPAILEVFFDEIHAYEEQPYYYRKNVKDLNKPSNMSLKSLVNLKRNKNIDPDL